MAVTIKDVARESGVNVSTVSRALNGEYGVHADTREHVVAVAQRLAVPSEPGGAGPGDGPLAHAGAGGQRHPQSLLRRSGARRRRCRLRAGYDLMLCNSDLDPDKQMRYAQSLMEKRVDGILMNSVAALSKKQQDQLSAARRADRAAQPHRPAQRVLHRLRGQRSGRRAGGGVPAETRAPQDRAPHRAAPSRQHDGAGQGLRGRAGRGAQAGAPGGAARQEQLSGRPGTGAEAAGAASRTSRRSSPPAT